MCSRISSTIKDRNNPNSHLSRDGGRERRLIRPLKKCKPLTVLALEFLPGFERLRVTRMPGLLNCSVALEGSWWCTQNLPRTETPWREMLRSEFVASHASSPSVFLDLGRHWSPSSPRCGEGAVCALDSSMGLFGSPTYWAALPKSPKPGSGHKQGRVICNHLEAANSAPGQLNGCNHCLPRPCQPCSPVMWFNGNKEPAGNGSMVLAHGGSRSRADRQTLVFSHAWRSVGCKQGWLAGFLGGIAPMVPLEQVFHPHWRGRSLFSFLS